MAAGTLLAALLLVAPTAAAQDKADAPARGIGTAVEGDLVSVKGQEFRLYGIDAPDRGQTCVNVKGREYDCFALSREVLRRLINDREIECTPHGKAPPAGPKFAICRAENGDDLAFAMVQRGYALAYRALSPAYVSVEARAISYRRGLWAGRVEPPWLWRSRQTADQLRLMRRPGPNP